MNKDVIYIDIEDDITGIIGKVKGSKEKIVALVPPKRVGVLQSAVNLKLLTKAAQSAGKRVVLITNEHSLIALAAGVKIPVAKNLQSKPEIPQLDAQESDVDEIINGAELPVGEIASSRMAPHDPPTKDEEDMMELGDTAIEASAPPRIKPAGMSGITAKLKDKAKSKVPNFERFRSRIFIFGGGGLLLILFLIWATLIAPHAEVTIVAKTNPISVDQVLTLDPALPQSDITSFKLKPTVKQLKKSVVAEFTATGTKDVGNAATGTLTLRNCDYPSGFTLEAGNKFTSGDGHVFTSTAKVTVPAFTGPASSCTLGGASSGKATVAVKAADIGPGYNLDAQGYDIDGVSGKVDAQGTAMAGGTKQTVTVVSQADVDKAKTTLPQQDEESAKNELRAQFGGDQQIIAESYLLEAGQPVVSPDVGQQAQQGKVTIETTYTFVSVARDDIKKVITSDVDLVLKSQSSQQVYDLGTDKVKFQSFQQLPGTPTYSTRLLTTAQAGPKVDTKALARQITGKRAGEVQQQISDIQGVDDVKVEYSPFWVNAAPGPDKINIKFSISNGK